jgi:hypothetical protein
MRNHSPSMLGQSLLGAALIAGSCLALPTSTQAGAAGMSCKQITDEEMAIMKQEGAIRLRIQAKPRPEGSNVKAARDLIALMPGVYAGGKGAQLLADARKMDDSDAFVDADQIKPGQTLTADQKQLKAVMARSAELRKAYLDNPDCDDHR